MAELCWVECMGEHQNCESQTIFLHFPSHNFLHPGCREVLHFDHPQPPGMSTLLSTCHCLRPKFLRKTVFLPHLSTCRQDAILLQVVTCPLQAHAFSLSNWTGFVQVQCHCVTWTQHDSTIKITLLRVIPTMTFIRFVTDKSSVT